MQLITAPVSRELLPPLLACLPTAFVSPRPPPALLPLLSPILRQRVNLLSSSNSAGNDGWLPLLSWDPQGASKLAGKIEGLQLEAHPVSGELELEDVNTIQYRRLDEETLQARLEVEEFDILPIYVWCTNDEGATGWRLAELRALEDRQDGTVWFDSTTEANEAAQAQPRHSIPTPAGNGHASTSADVDDDDDYWASYDRTPGGPTPARTPAKRSPAPNTHTFNSMASHQSSAEDDYYARYGTEVQPALDSHDPDEETPETQDSTLNGQTVLQPQAQSKNPPDLNMPSYGTSIPPSSTTKSSPAHALTSTLSTDQSIHTPRPTSPSSQGSVERLEQGAAEMTRAEVGVKQFVSTEIKSLFRLARSVGIDRGEFERIVKTQLDLLGLMEGDD